MATPCVCVCVCVLYKLHSEDHDMHLTNKVGTFTGPQDIESGLPTFKGLLGGLRLKSNVKVRVGVRSSLG